jgi:hypothetical protein
MTFPLLDGVVKKPMLGYFLWEGSFAVLVAATVGVSQAR